MLGIKLLDAQHVVCLRQQQILECFLLSFNATLVYHGQIFFQIIMMEFVVALKQQYHSLELSWYIIQTLKEKINPEHPIFQSRFWRDEWYKRLGDKVLPPVRLYRQETDMRATGVSENVQMWDRAERLMNRMGSFIKSVEKIPLSTPQLDAQAYSQQICLNLANMLTAAALQQQSPLSSCANIAVSPLQSTDIPISSAPPRPTEETVQTPTLQSLPLISYSVEQPIELPLPPIRLSKSMYLPSSSEASRTAAAAANAARAAAENAAIIAEAARREEERVRAERAWWKTWTWGGQLGRPVPECFVLETKMSLRGLLDVWHNGNKLTFVKVSIKYWF